ncbi:MAG: hypothetical protein QHJ73_10965, partial [Armatimonadota bacterium]|nr:hypothetical protein [Armatimonadota bacterium]
MRQAFALLAGTALLVSPSIAEETAGNRPYEMVWARRNHDPHPPLVDFSTVAGWSVETHNCDASLAVSGEQSVWGDLVAKLTYRGTGPGPRLVLRPPAPIQIPGGFDAATFWVYGNNWAWVPDPTTPPVHLALLLESNEGAAVRVPLGNVRWREWWLIHRRLGPDDIRRVAGGARLTGIEVTNGTNRQDRTIYLSHLAFFREALPPLTFAPRPKRGVEMFPGQSSGANTGPGRLPFPTREETILPDNLAKPFTTVVVAEGKGFLFRYRGSDGVLDYRYLPGAGTLDDVTARWHGRGTLFQPMAGGGVWLVVGEGSTAVPPNRAELLWCRREGNTVQARWRVSAAEKSAEVLYTFRLWQKSLVVDVECRGGNAGEVRLGAAAGVPAPRLVHVPYLTFGSSRPAVLVMGTLNQPLFLSAWVDFYRSNASELFAANDVKEDRALFNGGSRYLPKTDGQRNDCFERVFLTLSPRFEEVLPNLANPPSPWMHVAGERVWRAHGASDREKDYATWAEIVRYGMKKLVVCDHETGWRDGGESFTLRTRAAPGKGGDEAQAEYSRKMRALGIRYGLYTNYTDFAPVNGYWRNEDWVSRTPDGQLRPAWPRCYNLKPQRAVQMEALLAPIIKQKFGQDASYCDVHTAVSPWTYCDYDARVPGAGTFAATFY